MTAAQAAAWAAYALTQTKHDNRTGKSYHPSAITAFTALASKFLQANPSGAIPLTPPATAFSGEQFALTAAGGAAKVTFTTRTGNSPNITTDPYGR